MSQEIKNRMFADVQIDGDTLVFKAYLAFDDGSSELYDYFAVKKNTYAGARELVDALPESVTPRDAVALKQAKDSVDQLNERATKRLGEERISKMERLLATFNLDYALNAYEVIKTVDLLDIDNLNQDFWQNYATAKNLYYSLSEEEKELVVNSEILLSLEESITQKFLIEKVQQLINGIDGANDKEEARLVALQAYNLLTDASKEQIVGAEKLIVQEDNANYTWLYVLIGVVCAGAAACVALVVIKKRGANK